MADLHEYLRGERPPGRLAAAERRHRAAVRSRGRQQMIRLIKALDEVYAAASDFLDSHPAPCRCGFCSADSSVRGHIAADVAGVQWNAEIASSILSSIVPGGMSNWSAGSGEGTVNNG